MWSYKASQGYVAHARSKGIFNLRVFTYFETLCLIRDVVLMFQLKNLNSFNSRVDFIHSENIVILDKDQNIRDFINGTANNADEKILTSISKLKKIKENTRNF